MDPKDPHMKGRLRAVEQWKYCSGAATTASLSEDSGFPRFVDDAWIISRYLRNMVVSESMDLGNNLHRGKGSWEMGR
jgi:hypothetical protein